MMILATRKLFLIRTFLCDGLFLMLCGLTQVNQALGEDNLLSYDCDTFGHGVMVINLSNKKVYFLGGVTTIIDTLHDQNEFHNFSEVDDVYAFSEDDNFSVGLWLKNFDPYLEGPTMSLSFSFTWSVDVRNDSGELIGDNYAEGFCTRVSHH